MKLLIVEDSPAAKLPAPSNKAVSPVDKPSKLPLTLVFRGAVAITLSTVYPEPAVAPLKSGKVSVA